MSTTRIWLNARARAAFLAALGASSALGCAVSSDEEAVAVGHEEQPLYALSTRLWPRAAKIDVCWQPGASAADRQLVREAVTKTWQARSNISFVNWASCPASGFAGIEITPGSSNVVTGGLGDQADGVSNMELDLSTAPENTWSRCVNNGLNRSECIQATAIHEFGHSLSFAHEQRRPDNNGECTIGVTSGSLGDTLLGPFDNGSIMNYCGNAVTLSRGDVYGANVVYGIAPALLPSLL
jgi:hypothetical protein